MKAQFYIKIAVMIFTKESSSGKTNNETHDKVTYYVCSHTCFPKAGGNQQDTQQWWTNVSEHNPAENQSTSLSSRTSRSSLQLSSIEMSIGRVPESTEAQNVALAVVAVSRGTPPSPPPPLPLPIVIPSPFWLDACSCLTCLPGWSLSC